MVWRAAGPPGRVLISDLTDFGPVGGRCTDLTILGGLHSVGVMGRWVVVVCIRVRWMCGCADVTVCGVDVHMSGVACTRCAGSGDGICRSPPGGVG